MIKMNLNKFLLTNKTAYNLYEKVKDMPIFDYHCHLCPKDIYENRTFYNLTELWLEEDHYKWRVMRHAGIDESLITGNASPYRKFLAFASILPEFIGNPVYHWTAMELDKYFNITLPINKHTAEQIWNTTKTAMSDGSFNAQNLIKKSNVHTLITTDSPLDNLEYHNLIKNNKFNFSVLPCFRTDFIIDIENKGFSSSIAELSNQTQTNINGIDTLLKAVENRLIYFINNGAVVADCSFKNFPNAKNSKDIANIALTKRLNNNELTVAESYEYQFIILKELAKLFKKYDIIMQLHTGVLRNQNTNRLNCLGVDCGIDSVGDAVNIENAGKLFNCIEKDCGMPRTIVYTLNENSYYPLATMLGNFAGEVQGKMQLGAAWWFMDNKEGIIEQLKVYASTMGLGYFNGMLTDSRSFVSYVRHDYFRRILCSLIGEWVENGEYPNDFDSLVELVKNICFNNAKKYFVKGENI